MYDELNNRRVLVTAGASGIGKAIAQAFIAQGAQVLICDVDEELLAQCSQWGGTSVTGVKADVSNSAEVEEMFQVMEDVCGGIDVLINNAGISGPTKPFEEVTDEEWTRTLAVNVNGQFYCARRAASLMKSQNSGVIINMSSVAGRIGMPLRAPYSTSKYAVLGLTDVLAIELGEFNVRVNAILPGLVDGERGRHVVKAQAAKRNISPSEYLTAMLHNVSMHTLIDASEVASLAVFLASDAARHISSQHIGVCGNFESCRSPLDIKQSDVVFTG